MRQTMKACLIGARASCVAMGHTKIHDTLMCVVHRARARTRVAWGCDEARLHVRQSVHLPALRCLGLRQPTLPAQHLWVRGEGECVLVPNQEKITDQGTKLSSMSAWTPPPATLP